LRPLGRRDSAVTATLIEKAIGSNLTCVFVDHGLLRKGEAEQVKKVFGDTARFALNFIPVDRLRAFLVPLRRRERSRRKTQKSLAKPSSIPLSKFVKASPKPAIWLKEPSIRTASKAVWASPPRSSRTITSAACPRTSISMAIVEPLNNLFKDEVREVGLLLGLPNELVYRQPFPGPGLAIRIIGEVTRRRLQSSKTPMRFFAKNGQTCPSKKRPSQYFAALEQYAERRSDGRFENLRLCVVLRAVSTDDFMTAKPVELPYDILTTVSDRIVNEVKGVNRVLYDFTSKPPSTIELE
jgi:GMP synthase (glutamine-hydrolysing)